MAVGSVPITRNGNLLPYFERQLSDKDPIIGSVIASKTEAMAEASPANKGDRPST
jgi:hypothetical protein